MKTNNHVTSVTCGDIKLKFVWSIILPIFIVNYAILTIVFWLIFNGNNDIVLEHLLRYQSYLIKVLIKSSENVLLCFTIHSTDQMLSAQLPSDIYVAGWWQ